MKFVSESQNIYFSNDKISPVTKNFIAERSVSRRLQTCCHSYTEKIHIHRGRRRYNY